MNKNITYILFGFLFSIVSATSYAEAQSTTTILQESMQEGTNESQASTTSNLLWYRHREGSDLIAKIALLPTQIEQSIKMPVLFGVKVTDLSPNFGDPRSNGRTHLGEDIMALKGTPIVSPTKAVVLKMGVGAGEGDYVYTANPGGETYVYMHLDAFGEGVSEGSVLEQGSLIGYVGNTGNASGGLSHLHFEVHGTDGTALDPFKRLTAEFTLPEKISYLPTILSHAINTSSLSLLLATNFKSTFTDAISQSLPVPQNIQNMLSSITTNPTSAPSIAVTLPMGELALGSDGNEVISMQQALIYADSGPFTQRLKSAGTTGYFGAITQNALIEYQTKMNISPSNGYYDVVTKNKLMSSQSPTNTHQPIVTAISTTTSTSTLVTTKIIESFSTNLSKGMTSNDVLAIQKYLNTHGFMIASNGAGSPGNETNYFGSATQNAVINFQLSKNITPSLGFVGSITRGFINSTTQ